MTLDDIRQHYPKLGLALYAYEPGGAVTLEIHSAQGQVFSFTAPGEAAVLAKAFPELHEAPAVLEPQPPPPTANIFD